MCEILQWTIDIINNINDTPSPVYKNYLGQQKLTVEKM